MSDTDDDPRPPVVSDIVEQLREVANSDAFRASYLELQLHEAASTIESLTAELAASKAECDELKALALMEKVLNAKEIGRITAELSASKAECEAMAFSIVHLRFDNERLRAALSELVELRDLKTYVAIQLKSNKVSTSEHRDKMLKDYANRHPLAWEAARLALTGKGE